MALCRDSLNEDSVVQVRGGRIRMRNVHCLPLLLRAPVLLIRVGNFCGRVHASGAMCLVLAWLLEIANPSEKT